MAQDTATPDTPQTDAPKVSELDGQVVKAQAFVVEGPDGQAKEILDAEGHRSFDAESGRLRAHHHENGSTFYDKGTGAKYLAIDQLPGVMMPERITDAYFGRFRLFWPNGEDAIAITSHLGDGEDEVFMLDTLKEGHYPFSDLANEAERSFALCNGTASVSIKDENGEAILNIFAGRTHIDFGILGNTEFTISMDDSGQAVIGNARGAMVSISALLDGISDRIGGSEDDPKEPEGDNSEAVDGGGPDREGALPVALADTQPPITRGEVISAMERFASVEDGDRAGAALMSCGFNDSDRTRREFRALLASCAERKRPELHLPWRVEKNTIINSEGEVVLAAGASGRHENFLVMICILVNKDAGKYTVPAMAKYIAAPDTVLEVYRETLFGTPGDSGEQEEEA